jgi:RNA polymerase sigma factor (sigma-70 family)
MLPDGSSDAVLITAVRHGDVSAYGVLYERHLAAAKRAAACLATTPAEREDLVAEAFTRVLQTLRSGRGPHEEFRPYLLVTMRHLAINTARRTPSTALFAEVPDAYLPAGDDPVAARLHGSDAANAFAGLPERWRVVLWHTEVEGESPAAIAPLLGMTPNGVAALAYRAREGLRQAYLRLHVPAADQRECRAATDKLAGWVRRSISAPQRRKVAAHLAHCARCREVAAGLEQVNGELRAVLGPIVLGAPLAAAYLHATVITSATGGIATVSWLSAVKASVTTLAGQAGAAAAVAAVTAVTVVASDPGVSPPAGNGGVVAVQPPVQRHGSEITGTVPAPGGGTGPGSPAAEPAASPSGSTAGEEDGTGSAKTEKESNGQENAQGQQGAETAEAQEQAGQQGQAGQGQAQRTTPPVPAQGGKGKVPEPAATPASRPENQGGEER